MKTLLKTFAFAAFAVFATACSESAEVVTPSQNPAEISREAVEAPSEGRNTISNVQGYDAAETYYTNNNPAPETQSYTLEVTTDPTQPDMLNFVNLAGNPDLSVDARANGDGSFTLHQSYDNLRGFEGPVTISGAGEFSDKSLRIAYTLQMTGEELYAEVAAERQE